MSKKPKLRTHLCIPDVQTKQGVCTKHLRHVGKYIVDKRPDVVICLGDFADMPSLSSYDRGTKGFEGRRYKIDIDAAKKAMSILLAPLHAYNAMRAKQKMKQYYPEMHMILGNHEYRIQRAVDNDAVLEGTIGLEDLGYEEAGWTVHAFLETVDIDGILYSHFFPRSANGRVLQNRRGSPTASTQVKREMQSCTSGHLQGLDFNLYQTGTKRLYGLIAGSCYTHDEDYLSPQGTQYWRGLVMKHEVSNGEYDPMFVSLNYLKRRYG
jgi:hypothetical protein